VHQVADFLKGLETGTSAKPDFADGLATDYVVDAVLSSASSRKWVKVKQPKATKAPKAKAKAKA
jgi:hypothetical protein